jgi:hypothetical protein
MFRGIAKLVGGVVAIGIAVFAAIAAAGVAGEGLGEATNGNGDSEALRKVS